MTCHHMATYLHARVCTSVISKLSIVFTICVSPLNSLYLYTARITFIFIIWDYLSIYCMQAMWCDEKRLISALIFIFT